MPDPHELTTVREINLELLEEGIENSISFDRGTRAPGSKNSHPVNAIKDNILENQSLTQYITKRKTDKNENVVDRVTRHAIQDGRTNYVESRYGYTSEKNAIKPHTTWRIMSMYITGN